jgi:hypothetical protein
VDAVVVGNVSQYEIGSIPFLFFLVFDKNVYRVGFSFRLVEVETGEIRWTGSASGASLRSLEHCVRKSMKDVLASVSFEAQSHPAKTAEVQAVFNTSSSEAGAALPVAPASAEARLAGEPPNTCSPKAVVVGIARYQNSGERGLRNLSFAGSDARAFRDALIARNWEPDNIQCFIDEAATKNEIETWLRYGPDLKDSLFVLYWAGHGYPDPVDPQKLFLACYDTELSKPGTGLRMSDVRRWLEERNARNVVILADACHAGGLISSRGTEEVSARGFAIQMKPERVPTGWIYLLGARTADKAVEHPSIQGGLFTNALLSGLNGAADGFGMLGDKDGTITLGELREYVRQEVKDRAFQLHLSGEFETEVYTDTGDKNIWGLTLSGK